MVNTAELTEQFTRQFPGTTPEIRVRAPGRVNLIGEHTDYNDGWVLPIAMSQALHVVAGRTDGNTIEVHSTAFDETVRFDTTDPGPPGEKGWASYVRGVAAMLIRQDVILKPGRLLIDSQVPLGGGVSSSAALEVGTALALLGLAGAKMQPIPLALLARQAEHEYANSPCGIMDQFICVLGKQNHALLLDCRAQAYEQVPFTLTDSLLLVMNTQVKHDIGASEYPVRQRQCQEGLAAVSKLNPEVQSLRDATLKQLHACVGAMGDVAFRRCHHVVTEIARTTEAGRVLRRGELPVFGKLMFASHDSLRDDYEVTCPELDALVEIARETPGVHGARMTGGGFGGCAIALLERSAEQDLRKAITDRYDGRFDKPAIVYATEPSHGASIVPTPAR